MAAVIAWGAASGRRAFGTMPAVTPSRPSHAGRAPTAHFTRVLEAAWRRRATLAASSAVTAYRVLDGAGDGCAGVSLDRYGPAAVLNVDDDAQLSHDGVTEIADAALRLLASAGVTAVYVKPFVRDRSRLGGALPDEARAATPRAGTPLPATLVVEEYRVRF